MANNTIWIEKFKISSDLKAEFEKSSSDKSFLVWCLENGHVNEREYLSWASEEFQLPVVSEEFFADDDARDQWRSAWTTARFLHQWHASLLPLAESVGVVRVACLEIPELKLEQPVAYVLAPLSGMRSLWNEAFPPVQAVEAPPQAPIELSAELPPIELPPVELPSEAVTSPVIVEVTAASAPPPPPSQEFDANSLMSSWGSLEETPEVPSESEVENEELPQMPDGFGMPEGFSVDVPVPQMEASAPSVESVADIPIPSIDIPMPSFAKVAEAPAVEPMPVPTPPPIVAEAPSAVPTPPPIPAPQVIEKPTPAVAAKSNPPIPPMAPPAAGKPTGDFVGLIELRNAKDKVDQCQDLSEVANYAFSKFSRYFDRHMILMMKGFELRPFIWAGAWKLRSTRPAGINLDQPSIFRIVSRTKLPYHGYTKPSATNDMFFGEWSSGAAPAHLTLMPILVNDQLVGMLLGATDGSLDAKVALMDAERWMAEIAPHVARTKTAAPKAA